MSNHCPRRALSNSRKRVRNDESDGEQELAVEESASSSKQVSAATTEKDQEEQEEDQEQEEEESDEEDHQPCVICGDADATMKNQIIMCDGQGCDIPVHQNCYGLEKIPPGDEKWFCQRCEDNVPVEKTDAICCKSKEGAFVRTSFKDKYIHVPCAWWNTAVEYSKNMYTVEKWMLNKETCYICKENHGLTIRCKHPGCKKWFHVMCGVENGTIELCKNRSIKHNVVCTTHGVDKTDSLASSSTKGGAPSGLKKKVSTIDTDFTPEERESGGMSEDDDDHSSQQVQPKSASSSSINRANPKHSLKNVKPPISNTKRFDDVKAGSVPLSPASGSTAGSISWLMEKASALKEIAASLENVPLDFKKSLGVKPEALPMAAAVSSKEYSSPLDSLLDSAFEGRSNLLEQEIASLKSQLANRPTMESYQKLLDEVTKLKAQVSSNGHGGAGVCNLDQHKLDLHNIIHIFSHLKLPNLASPGEGNISQFLVTLRGILEKASKTQSPVSSQFPNN